ncbi:MAG: flavin reductase family protein [Planctomycetes bacterium]|nr:flavin reductase family protein [Planctomycetota bacterium]MCB9870221.1 flavin reductase family protein [Planctomycetota bacterium]MCB9888199.1 flavin reductase family protein [Planctomycetota bacterium]
MSDAPRDLAAALGRVSSGLYVVTTGTGDAATGFLGSWVMQAGFAPPAVTVAVQRDRPIRELLARCGHFCISVLAPSSMALMKHFARGFGPGENAFAGIDTRFAECGVPFLPQAHAHLVCRVLGETAWSDHVIVCGEVLSGSCADLAEAPLTHTRKNGLSY